MAIHHAESRDQRCEGEGEKMREKSEQGKKRKILLRARIAEPS